VNEGRDDRRKSGVRRSTSPLSDDDANAERRSRIQRLARGRILIVSGSREDCDLLASLFSPLAHTELVHTMKEAQHVVKCCDHVQSAVEAIICDAELPDGSGMELLAVARDWLPHLTELILFQSGPNAVDVAKLNRAAACGTLSAIKPLDDEFVAEFVYYIFSHYRHLADVIDKWAVECGLSPAEACILAMAAEGYSREAIALNRRSTRLTLKAQIHSVVQKTGDESFHSAVERLLREALVPSKSATRIQRPTPVNRK
jgi:DNA-binding NarL/FixJ family response regulator